MKGVKITSIHYVFIQILPANRGSESKAASIIAAKVKALLEKYGRTIPGNINTVELDPDIHSFEQTHVSLRGSCLGSLKHAALELSTWAEQHHELVLSSE